MPGLAIVAGVIVDRERIIDELARQLWLLSWQRSWNRWDDVPVDCKISWRARAVDVLHNLELIGVIVP